MDAARRRGGARGGAGAGAGDGAYDQLVDALEEHRHEEVRELRDRADRADRAGAGAGAGPGGDLRLVGKGGPEDVKVRGLRPPAAPRTLPCARRCRRRSRRRGRSRRFRASLHGANAHPNLPLPGSPPSVAREAPRTPMTELRGGPARSIFADRHAPD